MNKKIIDINMKSKCKICKIVYVTEETKYLNRKLIIKQ